MSDIFFSEAHNALIYRRADAGRFPAAIPNARLLARDLLAVPFDLPSMIVAKHVGLPAWSPILKYYSWPGRRTPRDVQRIMAAFLTLHPRGYNLSAMRTGKTFAALWAADYLMQIGLIKRALILSPLSTLERVWASAIFELFLNRRTAQILHGDRDDRFEALATPADFYIVNHDGVGIGTKRNGAHGALVLGEFAQTLIKRDDIDCVIGDEISAYKDRTTRRHKIIRAVLAPKRYVWGITGTPTPNAPTDAWALKKLLFPNIENFQTFRDRTMIRVSQFKWVPKKGAAEHVAAYLQPAIRFSREQVIDIPRAEIVQIPVRLSKAQLDAYQQLKATLQLELQTGKKITALNEATLRLKLIQISCSAVYGPDKEVNKIDAGPRFDALTEIAEEADRKLLIFAPLTSVVNLIYRELSQAGYRIARVTGGTAQAERNRVFGAFDPKIAAQENDPDIIVADPGCMAHGLDLSRASGIVWFGPSDRAETYEQANARIDGSGQTAKMTIFQFAATAIEREIFKRMDEKQSLQGLVLNLVQAG